MSVCQVNNIRFHIDFASDKRISGWIADINAMQWPLGLQIRLATGVSFEVYPRTITLRDDVCRELNLPLDLATGFDINLLDLTNDRCYQYSLMLGDHELWTYDDFLSELDNEVTLNLDIELTKEFGERQVILIYERNAWLHRQLAHIHRWRKAYFHKGYQSGISYFFSDVTELVAIKSKLLSSKNRGILIIDRSIHEIAFSSSPTLLSSWPLIILDKKIDLKRDFNGLLSGIAAINKMPNETLLRTSQLLKLLTSLSSYGDLFFDQKSDLYCIHSGVPRPWMQSLMKEQIQGSCHDDVIIISEKPLKRISEIEIDSVAVFIRVSATRFLFDLIVAESLELIKGAYSRGLKVKIVTREAP